jgi:glycosyltransferase involved in cell wall biosynthesis
MRIAIITTDTRESIRDAVHGSVANQPGIGIAPEALLQGFACVPEAEVHVVSCLKTELPSPERIAPNIFYHGVTVPQIGWLRTLYQGCIRGIRKKLQEIRPDIVHGQGTERYCALGAAFSGFPNVVTIHGNMKAVAKFFHAPPGSFYWLTARLETFTLRCTRGVFCNSAYTESQVAPRAAKTWQVANPVRRLFFETPISRSTKNVPVFLNVGTLTPYKRQKDILALFGKLWQQGVKFELQFAGSRGSRTDYGLSFARELAAAKQAGYARHIGMLSADRLLKAMDNADALIHTPLEESFGLVVAEALARNLKFFGSTTGGVVDIVNGVEGAELFAPQDWAGMEKAITSWLQTGRRQSCNAAQIMRERYHPEIIARQHLEIYREVIK